MSEVFSGEFVNAVDEKGRVMLPVKLRAPIGDSRLMLTRGIDDCLTLFPLPLWNKFLQQLFDTFSPLEKKFRLVQRRMVAPAQECVLSQGGRLSIPRSLLAAAGLHKECTLLGMHRYIELWDFNRYQEYLHTHDQEFVDAAEELGRQLGGFLNSA